MSDKIKQKNFKFKRAEIVQVNALKKSLGIPTEVGVVRFALKLAYDLNIKKIRRTGL